MIGTRFNEDLAQVCRILAQHRMLDLWGHASLRVPRSEVIAVTPRFHKGVLPQTITGDDILVCDLDGRVLEGRGELPLQFAVDLALYRASPNTGACIASSPKTALAAGISGASFQPITHMESETLFRKPANLPGDLATGEAGDATAALAAELKRAGLVQQRGIAVWTSGVDVFDALTVAYHYEYLAQANLVLAGTARPVAAVAQPDSERLWSQFSGQHHYIEFLQSLDPGSIAHPWHSFVAAHVRPDDPHGELKAAIALSCRALWTRDTLVAFLEHISHRLPEPDRFLMSAAHSFRDMLPEHLVLLDFRANWLGGPKPPNFKWFHAQLLAERTDAQAVVHTHDLYGRAYAGSIDRLVPASPIGLRIATLSLPVYPRCDLIVDAEVRRQTLDALGTGPIVHEVGHGTDFVATTLEQATVDAIQREQFLSLHNLAERFGTPRPLPAATVERLATVEPSADDWWWFHTAEIGAVRRSAGGLN